MIPLGSAVSRVAYIDDDSLRAKVVSSVLTGEVTGVREYTEEEPEDVFIPLLSLASPRREAVLAGCRDLCGQLLILIIDPQKTSNPETATVVAHFAALIGAAHPNELRHHVRSLLEIVLDPSVPANIRDSIVSLAVDYATDETDADYWQRHLDGDIIPSQAFQALLNINPRHPRVERGLVDIWIRSLREGLSIKVPFAVQRWSSLQPIVDVAIQGLIQKVIQTAPDIRAELAADCLRYRHSQDWVKFISEEELQPVQFAHFEAKSDKINLVDEDMILMGTDTFIQRLESSAWMSNLLESQRGNLRGRHEPKIVGLRGSLKEDWGFLSTRADARLSKIKFSTDDHGRTFHRLVLSHGGTQIEYEIWMETAFKTFTNNLMTQLAGFGPEQDILKKA